MLQVPAAGQDIRLASVELAVKRITEVQLRAAFNPIVYAETIPAFVDLRDGLRQSP